VGSAATGAADMYSDLDLLVYHRQVPRDEEVADTARELAAEAYRGAAWTDETGDRGYSERYSIDDVQCQVGHIAVGSFEREIKRLVIDLEVREDLLKIVSGLFEGLPLTGHELIERWRRDAAYTETLQRATIRARWDFFPWWYFEEKLRARDATVWRYDVLVHSAYNLVGVLAALNGIYFSTFEFKRTRALVSRFDVTPPNLAARLDALFASDEGRAIGELEKLVAETQALVAERFPDLEVVFEWDGKPTPPGERASPRAQR
jgi:hypothetical protein